MRILFVAAEAMEFEGILDRAETVQHAPVAADWARSCRIGGHDALLVANGAGWKRAAAAANAGIGHFQPEAVVSTGFCGAIAERLGVADVVVASEILVSGRSEGPIRTATVQSRHPDGPICSSDHIVRTAEEKRHLRGFGVCAVEMEAAGAAECAQAWGIPFYCVRAVTDLADETLANDFQAALRSDGHFDTMFILKGALRHPSVRMPELLRLRRRCKRAARALGDFFAVCGF